LITIVEYLKRKIYFTIEPALNYRRKRSEKFCMGHRLSRTGIGGFQLKSRISGAGVVAEGGGYIIGGGKDNR